MKTTDIPLDDLLKRLHLANAHRIWRDLVSRAEKESWGFGDFLATLVAQDEPARVSGTAPANFPEPAVSRSGGATSRVVEVALAI